MVLEALGQIASGARVQWTFIVLALYLREISVALTTIYVVKVKIQCGYQGAMLAIQCPANLIQRLTVCTWPHSP